MKNGIFKIVWLLAILAITLSLFPSIAYADTLTPNTTSINETHAWRNVLETGDALFTARYFVHYTGNLTPTTDISDTFIFRLMDITNTIELGVVEAYPYQNGGYDMGIVSWYFPAASAPTWGQAYWMRIEGKLTAFTTPPIYNYSIPAVSYSTAVTASAVETDMTNVLIQMAKTIGSSWTTPQALTDESEVGAILSEYGEAYFRPAIPGLQSMCPGLFYLQLGDITDPSVAWSTNLSVNASGLVQNTTLGGGIQGFSDLFDMSFSAVAAMPIILVCVALVIVGSAQGNMVSGLINSAVVLSGASLFGWFPMGVLMIISFFCGVYILYHLIWKQGG